MAPRCQRTPAAPFAAGGALLAVMRAVLDGEAPKDADIHHAEGVLRLLGLTAVDARRGRPQTAAAGGGAPGGVTGPTAATRPAAVPGRPTRRGLGSGWFNAISRPADGAGELMEVRRRACGGRWLRGSRLAIYAR